MPRSPLKPLSSAVLLFLLCASPARALDLMANHPGLAIEWIYKTEGAATDFALGDADGDGDPDLFVVDNSTLQLWLNNGRGEFAVQRTSICTFPVASVLAMDVDGDSRVDVVAAAQTGTGGIAFLKGLGAGRFAVPEISSAGRQYRDLVDAGTDSQGLRRIAAKVVEPTLGFDLLIQDRTAFRLSESFLTEMNVFALACADLNHDGSNDIIVSASAGSGETQIAVFLNRPNGFEAATRFSHSPFTLRFVPFDVDGDGNMDLLAAHEIGVDFLKGDGTGYEWAEQEDLASASGSTPPGVFATDLDLDGRAELLIAQRRGIGGTVLEEYRGALDLRASTPREFSFMHVQEGGTPPFAMLSGDLNGDGRVDLVMRTVKGGDGYNPTPNMVAVLLARPGGVPGGMRFQALEVNGYLLHSARFRVDGPPELIVSGGNGVFTTTLQGERLTPSKRVGDGFDVIVADLNRDRRDDMIIWGGWERPTLTDVRLTTVDGQPGEVSAQIEGRVVDVGDLNRDQHQDLIVQRPDHTFEVIWGDPQNRFRRVTGVPFTPPGENEYRENQVIADIDGDGHRELVQLRIHRHRHWDEDDEEGTPDTLTAWRLFPNGKTRLLAVSAVPPLTIPYTYVSEVRAANLDGKPGEELVLLIDPPGFNASYLTVLRAGGNGSYSLGSRCYLGGEVPTGLSLADLDGDGDLDAACTTSIEGYMGIVQIRWNDGDGNLIGEWGRRLAEGRGNGVAIDDFDGDGIADIAVLAPVYYQSTGSRIAFLFGRRDEISVPVSDIVFETTPAVAAVPALSIRSISPNPARNAFAIHWTARADEPVMLELHDVAGRRVRDERFESPSAGERETRFESLRDLPAGLYWLRLRQGSLTATKRVVLVR